MSKKPRKLHPKANLPVSLAAVHAFLDAQDNPNKYTDYDKGQIAGDLLKALRQAHTRYLEGQDDPNLTICVGKLGYVSPADVHKLRNGQIPLLTVYPRKKDTRHMALYFKHAPEYYANNKPVVKPGARNRKPSDKTTAVVNKTKFKKRA